MKYIKKFESFTAVDIDLIKKLYQQGITNSKEIQKELDFRKLDIDTIIEIVNKIKSNDEDNKII